MYFSLHNFFTQFVLGIPIRLYSIALMNHETSKTLYFHGTSIDAWEAMKATGKMDANKGDLIWNVSDGENYFYSAAELAKSESMEEDAIEWQNNFAFRRAAENASISAAFKRANKIVVLELDFADDEVSEDTSCANMSGAVCHSSPIPLSRIRRAFVSEDVTLLRTIQGIQIHDHEMLNGFELTRIEEQMAGAVKEIAICEELDSVEFEEVKI